MRRCFRRYYGILHGASEIPLNKEDLGRKLRLILPIDLDQKKELSCYSKALREVSREPFMASTLRYFSREPRISTPAPDIVYGYKSKAFSKKLEVGACNKSKVLFPYLIVEFEPMGGNMYHAANRCLGDSAVSLNLTESVVGYRQVVFSVCTNGQVADVYAMWSEEKSEDLPPGESSRRNHVMLHVDSLILVKFEDFEKLWHILYNIHRWGSRRRLSSLREKVDNMGYRRMFS